jgi:hypothetical protein
MANSMVKKLIVSYLAKKLQYFYGPRNAEQNHDLLIDNKLFENMAEVKYLETTGTNQNGFHEEIKSKLIARYSVKSLAFHIL